MALPIYQIENDADSALRRVSELVNDKIWRPVTPPGLSANQNQAQTNLVQKALTTATTAATTTPNAAGGLPLQVLSVSAVESPSKQQDRTYSEVSVSFTHNTADTNFASVKVWFIGYQGSSTPTLMTDGTTSPITFLVETTGETVTVKAQAVSPTGLTSDLSLAPSTTVLLDGVTSAPPAPSVTQNLLATPTGYQFQFAYETALLADVISGYNIYRYTANTPSSATIVKNVPQPSTNTGKYTYQEEVAAGTNYYYWVTSINTVGLESSKTAAQSGLVTSGSGLDNINDGSTKFGQTASGLSYRPTTNPVTGHDAGSNATINIASFTMRTSSKGDVSINSGSVTTLSYSTLYYVYYDDATLAGGSVTFAATTTKETALNASGRFFVGSVLTPASAAADTTGNNDGGTGAQVGTITVGQTTTTSGGYDANPNNGIGTQAGAGTLTETWTGVLTAPNFLFATAQSLKITSIVTFTSATGTAKLEYSLNNGSSYSTIYTASANRGSTVDTVSLSATQDVTQIWIRATITVSSGTKIVHNVKAIFTYTTS